MAGMVLAMLMGSPRHIVLAQGTTMRFECDPTDTTTCYSSVGHRCIGAVGDVVCTSQNGNPCIGQAPTCEQILEVNGVWGEDNGELCELGYWLEPEPGSAFPISIAASTAHLEDADGARSPEETPTTNTHWHPFCMTFDGVERIKTVHGTDPAALWHAARENAFCSGHPAKLPTTEFSSGEQTCVSQTGKRCVGPAPSCAQIIEVNDLWGVDNGELCDQGFWLEPPDGSNFPISISASIPHLEDGDTPTTNTHWHPFCVTEDGVERIKTVHGNDPAALWAAAQEKALCPNHPEGNLATGFSSDTNICKSQTGNRCLGPAPTCAEVLAVNDQWGVDNGELCDQGYWLEPEDHSDFPISIAASVDHLEDENGARSSDETPTTNTHWHPFCMTVDGVERIKTVHGTDPALLWAAAQEKAGCTDFHEALPLTGFSSSPSTRETHRSNSTSGRFELVDFMAAPTCSEIRDVDVLGVDGGDLCSDGWFTSPENGNTLPISIATSTDHRTTNDPLSNTHWHGFCRTEELGVERIPTSHGSGSETCSIWQDAMKQACCPDLMVPRMGLNGVIHPETCTAQNTSICRSQSGNECIGAAPTCEQIRAVDDAWGVDNGDMCSMGYWMEPEEGSKFPLSITTSYPHSTSLDDPKTNNHWIRKRSLAGVAQRVYCIQI